MKYDTPWQWNPVLGQYEMSDGKPRSGTGEISAIDAFSNRTVFLIGSTGFVGKVLLAMILDRFPELQRLIVQVRRRRNVTGEQRFYSEVLTAPPLRPIVDRMGGESAVRAKVTVVEGDVNEPLCGVQPDVVEQLRGKVDVVVNLAGVVDFDPPLPDSLVPNVYGAQHLVDLTRQLGARLVHISTCYVAGKKNGRISEDTPIEGYYPKRGESASAEVFNLDEELRWCEQFIRDCQADPSQGQRAIRERMRQGGMDRAEHWGWINTYTYTKSMGEQIIAATPGLSYAIVRPAIVESSMTFPFPGWNEGFTTSAPLILMGGEGVKSWPVRRDGSLEIIPVDLVAAGILIITAAVLCGRNKAVYHLATADTNPVMLPRLVSFLGMNARYKYKHKKSGNKLANLWKAYVETQIITTETLAAKRARLSRGLDVIHAMLNFAKTVLGPARIDPYLKSLRTTRRQIRQQEVTLDKFLPFMVHNSFIFETRNIREAAGMLTAKDLERLVWNPEAIDWADYWVNVHTKGIERWIRPAFVTERKAAAAS
ncbi:MAG TPA: SDR family oxidoreductase [Terriglobia bacterium]|nr:SDR family oxidoreductase [Terriglobia bacterium]